VIRFTRTYTAYTDCTTDTPDRNWRIVLFLVVPNKMKTNFFILRYIITRWQCCCVVLLSFYCFHAIYMRVVCRPASHTRSSLSYRHRRVVWEWIILVGFAVSITTRPTRCSMKRLGCIFLTFWRSCIPGPTEPICRTCRKMKPTRASGPWALDHNQMHTSYTHIPWQLSFLPSIPHLVPILRRPRLFANVKLYRFFLLGDFLRKMLFFF